MTGTGQEPVTDPQGSPGVVSPQNAEGFFAGPVDRPDEYELSGPGHKGGEGIVFRSHYQGSLPKAIPFAIKQLVAPPGVDPASWPEPRLIERWREQQKVLHLLRHPHLVGYREFFYGWPPHPRGTCSGEPPVSLGTWYLVMEWVEGPNLHDLVRAGTASLAERAGYVAQLAEAVEYLHSGRDTSGMVILHRDIKPGNVIINPERGAVLVDFGLIRVEEPTLTELPAWTGPYLAPEVHADKTRTSRASDMWAVAATAFFALTGLQPSPFEPDRMRRQLLEHVGRGNPVVTTVMAGLDPAADKRPQSPVAWAADLVRATKQASPITTPLPPGTPGTPGRARRSLRLPIGMAVAAAVVAAGVVVAFNLNSSPPARFTNTDHTATTSKTTTTAVVTAITGTVRDSQGRALADAYVISLDSASVARTDATGHYSMPCGSGPLVAATWLIPVSAGPSNQQKTTNYGPPPTTPGLGYAFSGAATDADSAAAATCDGIAVDFVLRAGGNAQIKFVTASGAPVTNSTDVIDNLYLPGLDEHAALETAPVDANGVQEVDQLAAGKLQIDWATATFSCSGPGVTNNPSLGDATVAITSGATTDVTCRET